MLMSRFHALLPCGRFALKDRGAVVGSSQQTRASRTDARLRSSQFLLTAKAMPQVECRCACALHEHVFHRETLCGLPDRAHQGRMRAYVVHPHILSVSEMIWAATVFNLNAELSITRTAASWTSCRRAKLLALVDSKRKHWQH